jgi:hypothetical protein
MTTSVCSHVAFTGASIHRPVPPSDGRHLRAIWTHAVLRMCVLQNVAVSACCGCQRDRPIEHVCMCNGAQINPPNLLWRGALVDKGGR